MAPPAMEDDQQQTPQPTQAPQRQMSSPPAATSITSPSSTATQAATGAYGQSPPFAGVSVRSYATGGATNAAPMDVPAAGVRSVSGSKPHGARFGVDVDGSAPSGALSSRSAPPPRRISPPLSASLTPPPARSGVVLPPLPPLLPFGASPNFGPLQPQPRNFSNSNLSLAHSPTGGTGATPLAFPSPSLSPGLALRSAQASPLPQQQSLFLQSPPLTFRPSSPAVPNLSLGTPPLGSSARTLPAGTVCSCKNDPAEAAPPCSCSMSHTPLLMSMATRPLVQSQSMDAFMLSRASSGGTGAAGMPAPTASGWSSLASSPLHAPLGSGPRRHPSMSMTGPYPSPSGASSHSLATTLSAASSAASLALLANGHGHGQGHGLSSLSSSGSGSHSAHLASMGMVQASQVPTAAHSNVTINIYTNQPHTHLLPTPVSTSHERHHSIFSPNAPADVVAIMQRQASVSPLDYSNSSATPTVTGASEGAGASASAQPAHTISINAPSPPSTPPTASTNMPLTASTVRLLRRAMRALRNIFPHGDPDPESPAAAAAAATATAASAGLAAVPSASSSASPSPRFTFAPRQLSPKHSLPPLHSPDRSPVQSARRPGSHSSNSAPPLTADSPRMQRAGEAETAAAEMRVALVQAQHSQTCAVWTHVLGAAWMATRWLTCDDAPALHLQSAGCSALFASGALVHLFAPAPVAPSWSGLLARVDRCGLSAAAMLGGVSTALTHFDGAGEQSRRCATVGLNAALGLVSMRALWRPEGSKAGQLGLLSLQALLCAFPALREYSRSGDQPLRALLRRSLLLATLCGVVAAILYIRRLPESIQPPPPSKLSRSVSSSDPLLPLSSLPVYLRFLSWLGQLGVRSSHLMHVCGVLAAHLAFVGLRDWTTRKQHLALTVQQTLAGAFA